MVKYIICRNIEFLILKCTVLDASEWVPSKVKLGNKEYNKEEEVK